MSWLFFALLSYFLLAIVSIFDRYLLAGPMPNPAAYAFYVGILWFAVAAMLLPLGVVVPVGTGLFLGLLAGFLRILAILFLVKSIFTGEVGRVVPAIGGLVPIFAFILFFLAAPYGEALGIYQAIAFLLLVCGSVMISQKNFSSRAIRLDELRYPIVSAFLFALSFFLTKSVFLETNFTSGLLVILLGGGLGALSFLLWPELRRSIVQHQTKRSVSFLFLLGQAIGGAGVFCQFYAIFLAKPFQVPLVNALEGVRYIFLLLFIYLFSLNNPFLLKEEIRGAHISQKILAVLLISIGIFILAIR